MTQRINTNPTLPIAGDPLTICYDGTGLELDKVTLTITWTPDTIPATTITIDLKETGTGCSVITVPNGAASMLIVDDSGNSSDYSSKIGEAASKAA